MYYPDEIVEQVRDANDIVDVIGQYVRLSKKGGTYFGLCPFHGEKTASFSVSRTKQMYYCFGCGAGGNVFTFLMEYENYTFTEALKYLADRAHITLPASNDGRESRRETELREKLLEINKKAAVFYHEKLRSDKGGQGLSYFKEKRGLSDKLITHFGLGYAGKNSTELYNYLKNAGYSDKLLADSGLVTVEERGAHDKFWNRVMFPIMDVNNRVVGFGGRVMGDGEPKYLNSPETKIFDKSKNLYGLNFARRSRKDYLLLCEGYMDVIALHQYGFTNAVASLGTAFNEKHARLLKRYTNKVVLTQDSDEAGIKAKLRALPILRNEGISAKVLDMSPYKDPDEFLKALGPEAFSDRIEKAKNAFLYEIDMLKRNFDLTDPEGKTDFYNAAAEKLCMFTEALERDNYVQTVAREHFIPYEDLKRLVNKKGLAAGFKSGSAGADMRGAEAKELSDGLNPFFNPSVRRASARGERRRDTGIMRSERLLLTGFSEAAELIPLIKAFISPDDFSDELYSEVAAEIYRSYEAGKFNPAAIIDKYAGDDDKRKRVAELFNAKPFIEARLAPSGGIGSEKAPYEEEDGSENADNKESGEELIKSVMDAVKRIKLNSLDIKMQSAVEADDIEAYQRLLVEKKDIDKNLKDIFGRSPI